MISSLFKSFREKKIEAEVITPDISRVFPHLRKAEISGTQAQTTPASEDAQVPSRPAPRDLDQETPEIGDSLDENIDTAAWIARDVATLHQAFEAYTARPGRDDVHRQLFISAHNLRGAAEPFGRPTIARIAGSLCQLLDATTAGEPIVAIVKLHVDAIRAAANLPEGPAQEELANAVCIALEDQVRTRLG
ncbi:MAG: Hpt domain-containing protein [Hyphomonadaceae bacterium]|nr:Hpt domain-containing protein [Hyphomonadaceae bacterium]